MHDTMGPTNEMQTAFETERRQVETCVNPAYSPKSDRSGCVRLKAL